MKLIIFKIAVLQIIFALTVFGQSSIDFISNLNEHNAVGYNDIWGYVDPSGNEYALLCAQDGLAVISLIDPSNPVEVAFIPGEQSIWRDVKVHNTYAYVVSDFTSDGLQIVDLSQLPDTAVLVNQITTWFTRSHNIFIDNGFAYAVGTNGGGGIHIIDLNNPVNPTRTAYYTTSGYVHDVYVWDDTVVACTGSTAEYHLVDVTNKSNPQFISASSSLPGIYAHSGWMTEDKRYFIAAEEFNVRDITIWDIQDRTTWTLVIPSWQTNSVSIIHNVFVLGNYLHISYYEDGYVVLNITDPADPKLEAQYDTHLPSPIGDYRGAWGVYPYLPSGLTLISDMQTGLYVLKFNPPTTLAEGEINPVNDFKLYQNFPNPFNPTTKIGFQISNPGLVSLRIYDVLGNEVAVLVNEQKAPGNYDVTFNAENLVSGIYLARLQTENIVKTIKMSLLK